MKISISNSHKKICIEIMCTFVENFQVILLIPCFKQTYNYAINATKRILLPFDSIVSYRIRARNVLNMLIFGRLVSLFY